MHEIEISEDVGSVLWGLRKGRTHKYIRRVPKPGGGYRYYYKTSGVTRSVKDDLTEGAKFKLTHEGQEGHFEVTGRSGDTVTLRHDESGGTMRVSAGALSDLLKREHADVVQAQRERTAKRLDAARRHGSPKQIARMEAEARRFGVGPAAPEMQDAELPSVDALKAKPEWSLTYPEFLKRWGWDGRRGQEPKALLREQIRGMREAVWSGAQIPVQVLSEYPMSDKSRDSMIQKMRETAGSGEVAPTGTPDGVWMQTPGQYAAAQGVQRPAVMEISGLQRQRMSKQGRDRYDRDWRERSERYSATMADYRRQIMEAVKAGTISANSPGLPPQVSKLIRDEQSAASVDAIKRAERKFKSALTNAKMQGTFGAGKGDRIFTTYGGIGHAEVVRAFKNHVRVQDEGGEIHRVPRMWLGMDAETAMRTALEGLSDAEVAAIARFGGHLGTNSTEQERVKAEASANEEAAKQEQARRAEA